MRAEAYGRLDDVLKDGARAHPDKVALIFEDERLTYADLDRRADAAAARLASAGVEAGDRVAVLARNSPIYLDLLFGASRAGAVFAPLNARLSAAEIAYIVGDAEAKVLVLDPALDALAHGLEGPTVLPLAHFADQAAGTAPSPAPHPPRGLRDLAVLIYTSGTTGQPKGVMLTHATFARYCGLDAPETPHDVAVRHDEVALNVLPLFHIGGIEFQLRPMFSGATVVLHGDFSIDRILTDVPRHQVTLMGLVPTGLQMMLRHPACGATDFSSVRRFIYGASPIPIGLLREGVERLRCEFLQSYGMTETGGTCGMLAPDDHRDPDAPRMRAAGRPIQGAQFRILEDESHIAPPHGVGEICIRGPGVMAGYWRKPEATVEVLDADGWLRSGDAGYLDEDGYLYVRDRVKDMIITGGENVYPIEVEDAVFGHPAVAEVAVVGVPDEKWGERVLAVVVAKPGAELVAEEVIAWTRMRLAAFKCPKSVVVVAELPKNAAGKVLRRAIREPYWRDQDRRAG